MTTKDIISYRKYMYRSVYDDKIYLVSIIDYFQIYNFFKYLETNYKSLFHTDKYKEGISCVAPNVYCNRFIEYVKTITDMEEANANGFTILIKKNI